jgi:prolipoprotein diacylglyceryl transferase
VIIWDVSPTIISWKFIDLRYYSFAFIIGFMFSYRYFLQAFKNEGISQYEDLTSQLFYYIMIATLLGARLGHILFYEPQVIWQNPLEILQVWKGGLASHGGYIAVIISVYLFSKRHSRFSFLWLMDRVAPCSVFTGSLIRLGNLMNSEIVGKPTQSDWGFVFKRLNEDFPRHPTQIYEFLGYFLISTSAFYLLKKHHKTWGQGRIFGYMLAIAFSFRFFIEFFKENQSQFENQMFWNMGQMLSLPFVVIGLFLFFREQQIAQPTPKNKKKSK